jgi:hypothetical protein
MSDHIYPTLAGLVPKVGRYPGFNTRVKASVSGRERRARFQLYPLWRFVLKYEFLRDTAAANELKKILSLFLVCGGQFDSFLFTDPDGCSETDHQFATCNGSDTTFQLTRKTTDGSLSFIEPVENVNVVTNVKRNGVALTPVTDYTVGATGIVSTAIAGTNGHALTWTGTYYNRSRFLFDEAQFDRMVAELWELGKCELRGAPGNKI